MAYASFTEPKHLGEGIIYEEEGPDRFSRELVTLLTGNNLEYGAVLAKTITSGTATATATSGNTGNGAMGSITVGAGAQDGTYLLEITAAATNAGAFLLRDPQGDVVGTGNVAAAFTGGGLAFTLADGATDFAKGDSFKIVVTALVAKRTVLAPAATDGTQIADCVLLRATDATDADTTALVMARHAILADTMLVWPSGATTAQKNIARAQLGERGIVIRDLTE